MDNLLSLIYRFLPLNLKEVRSFDEYEKDVFNLLTEKQKLNAMFEMSMMVNALQDALVNLDGRLSDMSSALDIACNQITDFYATFTDERTNPKEVKKQLLERVKNDER